MIENSWSSLAGEVCRRLNRTRIPSSVRPREEWEERIRAATGLSAKQADELIDCLRETKRRRGGIDEEWCREVLETVDFDAAEFARRVRSLGANIGFAGPDRGRGLPRFYCETPLLGTLVKGLCKDRSMPFEHFVTELRERFGLVL